MARVANGLVSKAPWGCARQQPCQRALGVLAPWPTFCFPGKTLPSMKEALVALERPQGRVPTTQLLPMGALPGGRWLSSRQRHKQCCVWSFAACRRILQLDTRLEMTWTLASGPG